MSSVFICQVNADHDSGLTSGRNIMFGPGMRVFKNHSTSPILRGGGNSIDSQHPDNYMWGINYTSFMIKRIEVKGFVISFADSQNISLVPDYAVLMKTPIPYTFDPNDWHYYSFISLQFFGLFHSPGLVLGSCVLPVKYGTGKHQYFSIIYDKPFRLGPNEGIFMDYLIHGIEYGPSSKVQATAKVWYDIA